MTLPHPEITVEEMQHIEDEHDGTLVTVTNLKVSASEKVSTGQYENYNPHATMDASVVSTGGWEAQRAQVLQTLLTMHQDLQGTLEMAVDRKLQAEPVGDQDDWLLQELLDEEAQADE